MKIDLSKIDGYEDMTLEEKLSALENYEDKEVTVNKKVFDKKASEAAEYSRKNKELAKQLEERMTDDEKREQEFLQIKTAYEDMKKQTKIAETKSQYLTLGYGEEMASETAKAFIEGDTATVFGNHKKFMEQYAKDLEAKLLDSQKGLTNGGQIPNTSERDKQIASLRQAMGLK